MLSNVASKDANLNQDANIEEWMTWYKAKHSEQPPQIFASQNWKGLGQAREETIKKGYDMQYVVSTLRKILKDAY